MTDRERATMLAALRYWQRNVFDHADSAGHRTLTVPASLAGHFEDDDPLSIQEIDALCEKLNAPEPKAPQWHIVPDDEADPSLKLFRIRGDANRHVASRVSEADAVLICDKVNADNHYRQSLGRARRREIILAGPVDKAALEYAAVSSGDLVVIPNEKITVGIFVEGGNVQGCRASSPHVEILMCDKDNIDAGDPDNTADYEALPHEIY